MKLEFLSQSVQYVFKNDAKYGDKLKRRVYNNVDKNAGAAALNSVGEALSSLQGDDLHETVLITKSVIGEGE